MKLLMIISYILMFVGALNWGLVGLLNFDLVAFLFGEASQVSRLVYSLVGIFAVVNLAISLSGKMSEEGGCCLSSS